MIARASDVTVSVARPKAHYLLVQRGASRAQQIAVVYAHQLDLFKPGGADVFWGRCWVERRRAWSRVKRVAVVHVVREADGNDLRTRGTVAHSGVAAW